MDKLFAAAQTALDALTALGAEKAGVRAQDSETLELNALGGEFTLMRSLLDRELSLTAIREGKRGTAKVNRLDADAIRQAAEECMAVAASGEADPAWDLAPAPETGDFSSGSPAADADRLFERSRELLESIAKEYPRVIVEEMITEHRLTREVYLNTVGSRFSNTEGYYSASLTFSGHEGDRATSFFGSGVTVPDLEKPFLALGALANDLESAERSLDAELTQGTHMGDILVHPDLLMDRLRDIMEWKNLFIVNGYGHSPVTPEAMYDWLITYGLGLFLATATAYFRDMMQFVSIALQVWFWMTPIVYFRELVERIASFGPTLLLANPLYYLSRSYQILFYENVVYFDFLPQGLLPAQKVFFPTLGILLLCGLAFSLFGSLVYLKLKKELPDQI